MKLMVTGSTGFVGTHLVGRLLHEGHEVISIVRPSTDPAMDNAKRYVFNGDIDALIGFMRQEQFDGVIQLASLFLAQHTSKNVSELIDSNVRFATSVLDAAVNVRVPWFINTGTFWQHYENADYSPVNLYAATKQAFEDIAKYYIATSPINFVTIKLSDTFGPGDKRPKVFTLWAKIAKSGESLDMSPGEQLIDISYIDNVIDGFIKMIDLLSDDNDRKLCGQSFAISSPQRMSLKDLAKLFERVTKTKLNIQWEKRDYRPREVMIPWDQGQPIPGWKPTVSLESGINKTFDTKQ